MGRCQNGAGVARQPRLDSLTGGRVTHRWHTVPMADEWLWVSHDDEVMARGTRELVEVERDAYERTCREEGTVPAVTYVRRATAPAASSPA